MSIPFVCEVCAYARELTEDYAGRRFRCPHCDAAAELGPDGAGAPAGAPERACPFCAETIKAEARKCRWCGEILDRRLAIAQQEARSKELERRRERVFREAPGAKGSLILGIIGLLVGPVFWPVGLLIGPLALLMGASALRILAREPRLEGRPAARAGLVLGILTLLATAAMLATGFHLGTLDD